MSVTVEEGSTFRYMPTAAIAGQLSAACTHGSVEPRLRTHSPTCWYAPSLSFDGVLPNEDSQSLVFDTTTLFQRDKFSGYDRIEGGTRLNAGLRYSGYI